jgi:hypothetical protein
MSGEGHFDLFRARQTGCGWTAAQNYKFGNGSPHSPVGTCPWRWPIFYLICPPENAESSACEIGEVTAIVGMASEGIGTMLRFCWEVLALALKARCYA